VRGHLRFSAPDSAAVLAASTHPLRDAPYHQPFMTESGRSAAGGAERSTVPRLSGPICRATDDVVFTVEYSIRCAMTAVYTLLKLDKGAAAGMGVLRPQVIAHPDAPPIAPIRCDRATMRASCPGGSRAGSRITGASEVARLRSAGALADDLVRIVGRDR
jgi:hypothetical protein